MYDSCCLTHWVVQNGPQAFGRASKLLKSSGTVAQFAQAAKSLIQYMNSRDDTNSHQKLVINMPL